MTEWLCQYMIYQDERCNKVLKHAGQQRWECADGHQQFHSARAPIAPRDTCIHGRPECVATDTCIKYNNGLCPRPYIGKPPHCGDQRCTNEHPTAWPLPDNSEQISPHSRACGWRPHDHGPACSTDCPTCHGLPLPAWLDPKTPSVEDADIPIAYQKIGAVRDALDAMEMFPFITEAIEWADGEQILQEFMPDEDDRAGRAALQMLIYRALSQFDRALLVKAMEQAHS